MWAGTLDPTEASATWTQSVSGAENTMKGERGKSAKGVAETLERKQCYETMKMWFFRRCLI